MKNPFKLKPEPPHIKYEVYTSECGFIEYVDRTVNPEWLMYQKTLTAKIRCAAKWLRGYRTFTVKL